MGGVNCPLWGHGQFILKRNWYDCNAVTQRPPSIVFKWIMNFSVIMIIIFRLRLPELTGINPIVRAERTNPLVFLLFIIQVSADDYLWALKCDWKLIGMLLSWCVWKWQKMNKAKGVNGAEQLFKVQFGWIELNSLKESMMMMSVWNNRINQRMPITWRRRVKWENYLAALKSSSWIETFPRRMDAH